MDNKNTNNNEIVPSDSQVPAEDNKIILGEEKHPDKYQPKKHDFKKIIISILSSVIVIVILIGIYYLTTREKKEIVIDKTCFSTSQSQSFIYDNEILLNVPKFFINRNTDIKVIKYTKYPVSNLGFLKFAKKPSGSKILSIYDISFSKENSFNDILEVTLSYDPSILYNENTKNTISAVYLDKESDSFKRLPSIIDEKNSKVKIFIDKPCMVSLAINFTNKHLPYTFNTQSDDSLFIEALKETTKKPSRDTCIYAFDSLINSFAPKNNLDTFYEEIKKLRSLNKFEDDFIKMGEWMLYEDISKRIIQSGLSKETISLIENTKNENLTYLAMNGILSQYYINYEYEYESIKDNELIYKKAYDLYFEEQLEMSDMDYYRTIKSFYLQNKTSDDFKNEIDSFITDLVYSFWSDVKNVATYQARIENSKSTASLTEETMNKISENKRMALIEQMTPILDTIMKQSYNKFRYDSFSLKEKLVYELYEPANIKLIFDAPDERLEKGIGIELTSEFDDKTYSKWSTTEDSFDINYSILEYLINDRADNISVKVIEQSGESREITKTIPNLAPNKNIKITYIIEPFLKIEPEKKTVKPGEEISFIGKRGDTDISNIEFQADGGQISVSGNYVAPEELGMYTITATSTNQYGFIETSKAYVYVE